MQWTNNYKICQFLERNSGFLNRKKSRNANFQIYKNFKNAQFEKIQKTFNLDNSKNFQYAKFQKFLICQTPNICDLENPENLQFVKV